MKGVPFSFNLRYTERVCQNVMQRRGKGLDLRAKPPRLELCRVDPE